MVQSPRYNLPYRRRRTGATNYKRRKRMVMSGQARLVVRPSLSNMVVQLVTAAPGGDSVQVSATSHELVKGFGWKGGCGNVPAAYLTGLLGGYKAVRAGISNSILDMGLHMKTRGSRIFAALKGALDAGLKIPHGTSILPSEERIRGEHLAAYAKHLATSTDRSKHFSQYKSRNLRPEDLPTHFQETVKRISSSFGMT